MLRKKTGPQQTGPPLTDAGGGHAYGVKGEPFVNLSADHDGDTMISFGEGLRRVLGLQIDTPAPPKRRRERKRSG